MSNDKKRTVMIVEDDPFVMDIYETKLTQEGFDVVLATNGLEAMKKLEEGIRPDVMLLDIMMPYKDGLEVLKDVRSQKKWKNISIILLTNLSQKEEVEEGLNLGANDYLIKSHFTPSEVLEKVNSHLKA